MSTEEPYKISISRSWVLLLSIFLLLNTLLFGMAIYTQMVITVDVQSLIAIIHQHEANTRKNSADIKINNEKLDEQDSLNNIVDDQLDQQSTRNIIVDDQLDKQQDEIGRINKLKSVMGSK